MFVVAPSHLMKINCLTRSLHVFLADQLYFRAYLPSKGTQQAIADWHLTIEHRGKKIDGNFLAAYETSWLAYEVQCFFFFSLSFVLYLTVFHTSLVLAKVSNRLLPEANKNDLLYVDKSTNSFTESFCNVCAICILMDIKLIIYLLHW